MKTDCETCKNARQDERYGDYKCLIKGYFIYDRSKIKDCQHYKKKDAK